MPMLSLEIVDATQKTPRGVPETQVNIIKFYINCEALNNLLQAKTFSEIQELHLFEKYCLNFQFTENYSKLRTMIFHHLIHYFPKAENKLLFCEFLKISTYSESNTSILDSMFDESERHRFCGVDIIALAYDYHLDNYTLNTGGISKEDHAEIDRVYRMLICMARALDIVPYLLYIFFCCRVVKFPLHDIVNADFDEVKIMKFHPHIIRLAIQKELPLFKNILGFNNTKDSIFTTPFIC